MIPLLTLFGLRRRCISRVPATYGECAAGVRASHAGARSAPGHLGCSSPWGTGRMEGERGLSAKDGIALTAERYSEYNTNGGGIDLSRPSRSCLVSAQLARTA